jgi:hypothetical protein
MYAPSVAPTTTTKRLSLREFAKRFPKARVRLYFQNANGCGELILPVEKALTPNASGRYFPPEGVSAATLRWPVPFWFGNECVAWSSAV